MSFLGKQMSSSWRVPVPPKPLAPLLPFNRKRLAPRQSRNVGHEVYPLIATDLPKAAYLTGRQRAKVSIKHSPIVHVILIVVPSSS